MGRRERISSRVEIILWLDQSFNTRTGWSMRNARWATTFITRATWTCWKGRAGNFCADSAAPPRQWQEAGTAFPVIGVEISYKAPARYDDLLTIELWVAEIGGVRLNVGFRILNPPARCWPKE